MLKSTCTFERCDKPVKCRGYCSAHYERLRKHGDPSVTLPNVPPPTPKRTQQDACDVTGCVKSTIARGYCNSHYRRFMKWGDPAYKRPVAIERQCRIAECESPNEKRGWCGKHYLRWYKHGDPEFLLPRYTECQEQGCINPPRSTLTPLCEMHYYRIRRNGTTELRDMCRPDAKYRAAHSRIARDRGKAREHSCVDCGCQAQHWSYMHTDPCEMVSPTGQPYSLDPAHYEPRCAPCHAIFDGTGQNGFTGPKLRLAS